MTSAVESVSDMSCIVQHVFIDLCDDHSTFLSVISDMQCVNAELFFYIPMLDIEEYVKVRMFYFICRLQAFRIV